MLVGPISLLFPLFANLSLEEKCTQRLSSQAHWSRTFWTLFLCLGNLPPYERYLTSGATTNLLSQPPLQQEHRHHVGSWPGTSILKNDVRQYSVESASIAPGTRLPRDLTFKSQLCLSLPVWSWASYLTLQYLSFHICNMREHNRSTSIVGWCVG